MLTLALHHDESVFVYLSETQKGKRRIEQLGLFSPGFTLDRAFLYQNNAVSLLKDMIKEVLQVLSISKESIYFSFPADLVYVSFYEQVPKERIQSVIDKDVWLTELKFGNQFIEESDCQVKVIYHQKDKADLTCIYFPKKLYKIIHKACHQNGCEIVGLGINIFNATEIAHNAYTGENYIVVQIENNLYELVNVISDRIAGYARFAFINGHFLFYARSGNIPGGLCEALVKRDPEILQTHQIYLTGNSTSLDHLHDIKKAHPNIRLLNPMSVNKSYTKPTVNYNEQYDTVFSSALGAMI